MMRINTILYDSIANGPGKRNVLWMQGCDTHCKGCMNKELWDWEGGREEYIVDIAEQLLSNDPEGITISGGEPLSQPGSLDGLLKALRKAKPNLSIILFTGYEGSYLEYCKENFSIFDNIDVAITGPFKEDKAEGVIDLRGSSNQHIWFLSERHSIEDLMRQTDVEVLIDETTSITGFPTPNAARAIQENLGA